MIGCKTRIQQNTNSDILKNILTAKNGKRLGFEIKYTDYPKITRSMRVAFQDLKLDHLYVIFPGKESFSLDTHITACGLSVLQKIIDF